MHIRPYTVDDAEAWDRLCAASPAATFLHRRAFMAHHGERFKDRSLVLQTEPGGAWLAVLPAAEAPGDPGTVDSHPGLTYGGFVHTGALRGERSLEALRACAAHFAAQGYQRFRYKPLPSIYQAAPAQDDLYALFRLGAQRSVCNLSCCIDLAQRWPVSERRRRGAGKAAKAGLRYAEGSAHAPALWQVLEHNLASKHGSQPVHSVGEIQGLAQRLPEHIHFHVACLGDEVVAGCVVFRAGPVHHLQYIASIEAGQAVAALDGLFTHLIDVAQQAGARYFDFGTSNEDRGRVLNEGLYRFKSEFGGGGVAYETYEWPLAPVAGN